MNYKLIIAIVIIAVLIAGGIVQEIWLKKTLAEFEERILTITPGESGAYDIGEIKELHKWWKKRSFILEVFLPHTLLNSIDSNFGELTGAVEANDDKTAQAVLTRVLFECRTLSETANIRLGNIF